MSPGQSRLDDALLAAGQATPPPPSPRLMALVHGAGPVAPRRPGLALGLVVLASLLIVALHVHSHDLRGDFAAIAQGPFWTTAGALLAAFVAALWMALLPRAGSMFGDARLARFAAIVVPALAVMLAAFARADAPPETTIPSGTQTLAAIESCLVNGLEVCAVPFVLGVLVLLRAPMPLQTRWFGAAVGAANGALAGLMLHFVCGRGGLLHVEVAHAGQAVIGAIVGALLVPALVARRVE